MNINKKNLTRLGPCYIITLLLVFIISSGSVFSQETLKGYMPSVAAPSPTAFSFMNYGNIPVEGYDGSFTTSVPLFSERYRDVDIPINLSYRSNGVPIDALSGIMGTDWTLNAGGAVTRVMRGIPDDLAETRWYPVQINPENSLDYSNILESSNGINVDSEQDWFSYNVNGISGKFYLDADLNVVSVGGNDEKIVLERTNITSNYGQILRFTITDSRGYQYIFGGDLNYIEGNMLRRDCFIGPKPTFQSAWFLKEIISPKNTRVSFEYLAYTIDNVTSVVHSRSYGKSCQGDMMSGYKVTIGDCIYSTLSSTRALSKITFGNYSLAFTYNDIRLDGGGLKLDNIKLLDNTNILKSINCFYEEVLSTAPIGEPSLKTSNKLKYRYFLKELRFNNADNIADSKYLFDYYALDQLPPRFSYSRDRFGYFNGSANYSPFSNEIKNAGEYILDIFNQTGGIGFATASDNVNENVVHYGQLSKITYPTGGYTDISYEANKTQYTSSIKEPIYHLMPAQVDCGENEAVNTFRFISDGESTKIVSNARYFEYPNMPCTNSPDQLHDLQMLTVTDLVSNTIILSMTRKVNETIQTSFQAIKGREYEVRYKLTTKFNSLYGTLQFWYNLYESTRTYDYYADGTRLRSLTNISGNGKQEQRKFYYTPLSNIGGAVTTLHAPFPPRYYEMSKIQIPCGGATYPIMVETDFLRVTSSNINQLYNFRGAKTFYSTITESISSEGGQSNGYIERHFNAVEDISPFPEFGPMIYGVPYSNISEGILGNISQKKWFDSSKSIKKEELFEYQILRESRNKNWVFRKNYDITGATNPAADMQAGSYSAVHYFNHYIDRKLKQVTSNDYHISGKVSSSTLHEYNGNGHQQITKSTRILSDGKSSITTFYYPHDLLTSGIVHIADLMQRNMLMPVITKSFVNNNLVAEETGGFEKINNLILLKSVNKKFGPEQNRIDKSININRFDGNGNPLEMTTQSNSSIVYLWGYGSQYPIAEITNATYSQVATVLTQATIDNLNVSTHSEATMETLIRAAADKLRTGLPNAMVTSYTYKPLVGMTSKTDERGVKETYKYDGMQRLEAILDHLNQATKAFDYHYRPN